MRVDGFALDVEHVPGRASDQDLRREHLPQLGHEVLKRPDRCLRWSLTPKLVDQTVGRDDLARTQRQQREELALLSSAQLDRESLHTGFERPQQPNLNERHLSLELNTFLAGPYRGGGTREGVTA